MARTRLLSLLKLLILGLEVPAVASIFAVDAVKSRARAHMYFVTRLRSIPSVCKLNFCRDGKTIFYYAFLLKILKSSHVFDICSAFTHRRPKVGDICILFPDSV